MPDETVKAWQGLPAAAGRDDVIDACPVRQRQPQLGEPLQLLLEPDTASAAVSSSADGGELPSELPPVDIRAEPMAGPHPR